MSIERKPTVFGDLRGWIAALHDVGEINEIDAEVDWNIELGTIMRLAQGAGDGPLLGIESTHWLIWYLSEMETVLIWPKLAICMSDIISPSH